AFGDGAATLIGRRSTAVSSGRRLPWNPDKSFAGTLAFVVSGGAAGVVLAWWVRPAIAPMPPMSFTIAAPLIAAIVAAMIETIPVRLDDNISVPATAAVVLWLGSVMTVTSLSASRDAIAS